VKLTRRICLPAYKPGYRGKQARKLREAIKKSAFYHSLACGIPGQNRINTPARWITYLLKIVVNPGVGVF